MKTKLTYWPVIALVLFSCASPGDKQAFRYDICIYGGTSAGVIAAYSAAKMGKSIILIEAGAHPGGLSSGGLGYTDIGNKSAITGLSRDFYRKIGKHYGTFEQWIFEPHVAEDIFRGYLENANIEVLYNHRLKAVEIADGSIKRITVENSQNPSAATDQDLSARVFIDCSYEGDLMAKAGVSYTVGREANSVYGETYNGVQLRDQHQFPDGVDPYRIPGDASSGLLWGISDAILADQGTGDKKVQSYNFRICLSDDPENLIPVTRPPDYDSLRYELLVRLFDAQQGKRALTDYITLSLMPNHKTDINNRGAFSTDMIGMNYDYPEAGYDERAEIIQRHTHYTKGLLYFFGHDKRVPEPIRSEMLRWGYPKDEYTDNGNWSPQPYIRECRRMTGSYVMTQANCLGSAKVDDGVGMAAYTMDSHNCQRIVVNGMVKNEGDVQIGGFGPYPISYRSIIPKEEECGNLLVPVCLSASHIAYGSIRMEPVFMVLGQSAAVAASLAIDNGTTVQQVNVGTIQVILKENPKLDGTPPEILVDNDDSLHITLEGNWKTETTGGYGPTFLVSPSSIPGNTVRFRPEVAVAADYMIYAYIPKIPGLADHIKFIVNDSEESNEQDIATDIEVSGQTSGEWISLGNFNLSSGPSNFVEIKSANTGGNVVADAVLFVPAQ